MFRFGRPCVSGASVEKNFRTLDPGSQGGLPPSGDAMSTSNPASEKTQYGAAASSSQYPASAATVNKPAFESGTPMRRN